MQRDGTVMIIGTSNSWLLSEVVAEQSIAAGEDRSLCNAYDKSARDDRELGQIRHQRHDC